MLYRLYNRSLWRVFARKSLWRARATPSTRWGLLAKLYLKLVNSKAIFHSKYLANRMAIMARLYYQQRWYQDWSAIKDFFRMNRAGRLRRRELVECILDISECAL